MKQMQQGSALKAHTAHWQVLGVLQLFKLSLSHESDFRSNFAYVIATINCRSEQGLVLYSFRSIELRR